MVRIITNASDSPNKYLETDIILMVDILLITHVWHLVVLYISWYSNGY